MRLAVKERLMLLDVLPTEGDVTTLLVVREAQEALGFDAEEFSTLEFRNEAGRMFWNEQKAEDKEIDLTDAARDIIVQQLRSMNDRRVLNLDLLPLYQRFVERKE